MRFTPRAYITHHAAHNTTGQKGIALDSPRRFNERQPSHPRGNVSNGLLTPRNKLRLRTRIESIGASAAQTHRPPHSFTKETTYMFDKVNELIVTADTRREQAQGMVEYGLILALVAVAALLVLTGIGHQVSTVFSSVSSAL